MSDPKIERIWNKQELHNTYLRDLSVAEYLAKCTRLMAWFEKECERQTRTGVGANLLPRKIIPSTMREMCAAIEAKDET